MAKLTVKDTPSEQLVKQAVEQVEVPDTRGRKITLRKPGVLAQYRLVKILGESAKNDVYMGMVLPLIFVSAIDGEAVSFPNSEREIEALIQRLDEAGIAAVMQGVQDHFGTVDPEQTKADVKN